MIGFVVAAEYSVDEQTHVRLFGRLENGESFASINTLIPYFFIKEYDAKKHTNLLTKYSSEKTSYATFQGDPVVKISHLSSTELNKLVEILHKLDIDTFEADMKPHMRFLIDNNLFGSIDINGDYETAERVHRVYTNADITAAAFTPSLKVFSLDTESNKATGTLFCIGLYSRTYQKTFMVTNKKMNNVIPCKDEADCLEKFKQEIIKQDPDIITGWNVIEFDLVYLKSLFKKHHIPFDLGRTNEEAHLRIESNFFRPSTADIPGRQVLDAFYLIKDPFIKEAPTIKHAAFASFALEDVAQELLGEGKLITGKNRHVEIEHLYTTNQQKLVDYNILDCKLAFNILQKTDMLNLAIERSRLTGLPLDRLGASVAAFDSLYLREARKRSLVSPTTKYTQKEKGIVGGYVKSLKPGIYHNVLVLDFKSLYPSIIRTFNIDPASFLEKKEKHAIEAPNKTYFKNTDGILPALLEKLHAAREQAKKEKRELANYAIKIIMNSFFGVLANPNCRYYNYDMANAITHFGQMIIKLTAEQIEKQGYKVIYQDTDSVFLESKFAKEKAITLGKNIQDSINAFYKNYIKERYHRTSHLELEFEKLYLTLMIPALRITGKSKAAKKRYAGLAAKDNKEELEIIGLEAIRGDWTEAAGDFQRELLLKVFHNESPETFIKNYIKKIKEGKLDDKLIYRKSIRKELDEYTKTTPPHVKAARMLDKLDSNVIEYVITTKGPEPLQKHKHKLDYEHYIDKQIAPIANQILSLFNKSFDDVMKGSKQKTLF